jgi:hypothetical protein
MKSLSTRSLALALALAMTTGPVLAQDRAATTQTAGIAAASQDCGKAPMKPHNHAAEKGAVGSNPPTIPACGGAAASAPAKGAKTQPLHNHGTFNKNQ